MYLKFSNYFRFVYRVRNLSSAPEFGPLIYMYDVWHAKDLQCILSESEITFPNP